ncbi:hypothetical protein D3C76_1285480 [compost metagenome]
MRPSQHLLFLGVLPVLLLVPLEENIGEHRRKDEFLNEFHQNAAHLLINIRLEVTKELRTAELAKQQRGIASNAIAHRPCPDRGIAVGCVKRLVREDDQSASRR